MNFADIIMFMAPKWFKTTHIKILLVIIINLILKIIEVYNVFNYAYLNIYNIIVINIKKLY